MRILQLAHTHRLRAPARLFALVCLAAMRIRRYSSVDNGVLLQGKLSREFEQALGWFGSPEIAHRDNIGLLALQNSPHRPGGPGSSGDLEAPNGIAQPAQDVAAAAAGARVSPAAQAAPADAAAAAASPPHPGAGAALAAGGGAVSAARQPASTVSSTVAAGMPAAQAALQQQHDGGGESMAQPSSAAATAQPRVADGSR